MKILISGSRGFIGNAIGQQAAIEGHEVLGLGRASQATKGWPGAYLQTDVATADLSNSILAFEPEVVIHAAGTASVGGSFTTPLEDFRASALTWTNMLEGVRRSGLSPLVVHLGSAAVYGTTADLPISENAAIQPISPYGYHKAVCEFVAQEYAQCFDLRTVSCRLFSVFGPAQRRLLIWELYRAAQNEETVSLKGTGDESRDYLHVEDVATAIVRLGEKLSDAPSLNAVVNVASGEETSVLDLANMIRDLVAPAKTVVARGEISPGDPRNWRADTGRLRSIIPDWKPRPFSERLSSCIRSWQDEVV